MADKHDSTRHREAIIAALDEGEKQLFHMIALLSENLGRHSRQLRQSILAELDRLEQEAGK